MKIKRHEKILELIAAHSIDTQEELQKHLKESGFEVTQATVSELRLVKTLSSDGKYKYAVTSKEAARDISYKFHAIFTESVMSIDYAMNTVVVKCFVGMAQAACAALDSMRWDGIVGTLAGDDTIFILMRSEAAAVQLVEELMKLLDK